MNLAARLEAHTKVAGRHILLDGGTRSELDAALRTDALGSVALKGFAAPIEVYAHG